MHRLSSNSQKITERSVPNIGSSLVESILDSSSPWSTNSKISDKCRKYIQMYETCLSDTTFTCQEYMDKIQIHCNDRK